MCTECVELYSVQGTLGATAASLARKYYVSERFANDLGFAQVLGNHSKQLKLNPTRGTAVLISKIQNV